MAVGGNAHSITEELLRWPYLRIVCARRRLSYPNFRLYLLARFLATVSFEMQSVAVGLQIYELTHKALDLGLVGLAQFLPGICLFLITGNVADRLPRQRIVRACAAAFGLCSALLLFFTLRRVTTPYPSMQLYC